MGEAVGVRLVPADLALVDRIAAANGARSDVVRQAVDEYLARHTARPEETS